MALIFARRGHLHQKQINNLFFVSKPRLQFHAEQIARDILENFGAPYYCLPPEQIQKRARISSEAARVVVMPTLEIIRRESVEDGAMGGS